MSKPTRQEAINKLYEAYSDAGDDDMNARLRIKEFVAELMDNTLELGVEKITNLEGFLANAYPITDEELDIAEQVYYEEEE